MPLRDGGNLSAGSWPMRAAAHAAADRRRPGGDGGFGGTSQAIAGPGRAFPCGEAPPAAGRSAGGRPSGALPEAACVRTCREVAPVGVSPPILLSLP
ncbi:hypothetical protein D516_2471 [Rhodobacter sp. AKP1]|nr:hypothetical protein D516_2471 [Rhodobacter sp. AKP1]